MIVCHQVCILKNPLVRVNTINRNIAESKSVRCNGKSYQLCQYIKEIHKCEDADGNKYDIRKGIMNYNTNFTLYKFHCRTLSKPYEESNIIGFCY